MPFALFSLFHIRPWPFQHASTSEKMEPLLNKRPPPRCTTLQSLHIKAMWVLYHSHSAERGVSAGQGCGLSESLSGERPEGLPVAASTLSHSATTLAAWPGSRRTWNSMELPQTLDSHPCGVVGLRLVGTPPQGFCSRQTGISVRGHHHPIPTASLSQAPLRPPAVLLWSLRNCS